MYNIFLKLLLWLCVHHVRMRYCVESYSNSTVNDYIHIHELMHHSQPPKPLGFVLPPTLPLNLASSTGPDRGWWRLSVAADLGALLAFSLSFIATAATKGKLSYDVLYSEESRESTGLVIVMLWLLLLLCSGPQRSR